MSSLSKMLFAFFIVALVPLPLAAWPRTDLVSSTGQGWIEDLTLDPQLNPVAVAFLHGKQTVVKLSRTTGQVIWSQALAPLSLQWNTLVFVWLENGPWYPARVRTSASGDVFVASFALVPGTELIVAALDGSSGNHLWSRNLGPGVASGLELDGAGDLIVSRAHWDDEEPKVVKLAAADGAILWESAVTMGIARIAVDASGDVFAAGSQLHPLGPGSPSYSMTKIDGSTGASLWSQGCELPRKLVVDSAGDLIVGGGRNIAILNEVQKFDGATGAVQWISQVEVLVRDLALTSTNDVIAVGSWQNGPNFNYVEGRVLRLDGLTGVKLWSSVTAGSRGFLAAAVDADDDVYAAGSIDGVEDASMALVRKLGAATGSLVWDWKINGTSNPQFPNANLGGQWASSVVLDGAGYLYTGGAVINLHSNVNQQDAFVARRYAIDTSSFYPGELNPLWDNWLLWVYGYYDIDHLHEVIEDALVNDLRLKGAIWTDKVEMLLKATDRIVLLTPPNEVEALQWIIMNHQALVKRKAPIHLFLLEGGEGAALLDLIGEKLKILLAKTTR